MDKVKEILKQWNLEELTESFIEHEIDDDTFDKLSNDIIKELIPKIGRRIKFVNKYEEYQRINNLERHRDSPVGSRVSVTSDASTDTNTSSTPSIATLTATKSFYGLDEYRTLANPAEYLNLEDILSSSFTGQCVLNYYKKNNILDRKSRSNLVDITIKYIFQSYNSQLTNQQLKTISEKIIKLFPTECLETYYVDAVHKSSRYHEKSLPAKGKLVDKYRNCRTKLKTAGLLESTSNQSTEEEITEPETKSKTWLISRSDPWEDVIKHWNASFNCRKQLKTKTVGGILDEWPILKDPRSFVLIDIDFEKLYTTCELLTIEQWTTFFEKVYDLKKDNCKEHELVHLLKEDLPQNTRVCVQLKLINAIVPPKGRSRKGKKHWKPSTLESQEGIFCHANAPAEINEIINNKREEKYQLGQTVQPYIVTEGSELKEIRKAYVVVDNLQYEFNNTLRALEVCFRLFHVFNAAYPTEAEHIWSLLQWGLFRIHSKWDRPIPYLMDIVRALE